MKVDTEKLIKHRFWIMTGLCVPLALIALLMLYTGVKGKIRAEQKKVADEIKTIKSFSDPKRPDEVRFKEKEAKLHKKLEDNVWKKAWEKQADTSTWPEGLEKDFHFKDGLFALKIQAERTKAAAADETAGAAPSGEAPADQFQGVITMHNKDVIEVEGKAAKGAKRKPLRRFQRTAAVKGKVTLSDEKDKDKVIPFSDLKNGDRVTVTFQQGKYFGEELTPDAELEAFKKSYQSQLPEILQKVHPVDQSGKGVVQLRGWLFQDDPEQIPPAAGFLVHHAGPWQPNRYLSKEAWTAQEDLWVQRELYRLVDLANSFVSRFHAKPGETSEGKGKAFTFTNPYWELKLTLTSDDKLKVNLKNLLHRRQKADVNFRIKFRRDGPPEEVFVGGLEPLNPLDDKDAPKLIAIKTDSPTGIYEVEQVLTQDTAAVRRIDVIAIGAGGAAGAAGKAGGAVAGVGLPRGAGGRPGGPGGAPGSGGKSMALSNRTFVKPLVAFHFPGDPTEVEGGDKDAAQQTPAGNPRPGPGNMKMPTGLPGAPGGPSVPGGAAGAKGAPSVNGFVFDRYLDVTREARRIPVGIVLIVDQQHVGLVQAAFADSRLRFLTNQVLLNRYPQSLRTQGTILVAGGGKGAAPGVPALPGRAYGPAGFPGLRPPGFAGGPAGRFPFGAGRGPRGNMPGQVIFPGMTGAGSPGAGGAADEPETNVELVLYGVVSLYERYPPRSSGN